MNRREFMKFLPAGVAAAFGVKIASGHTSWWERVYANYDDLWLTQPNRPTSPHCDLTLDSLKRAVVEFETHVHYSYNGYVNLYEALWEQQCRGK